jgi:chemotaxis protein MotB
VAGKGGGGAWKVAYADFVTAMMAFFLVMWICGQDQKLRGAVSHYFNDPFDTSKIGSSKQPSRTGSVSDIQSRGSTPDAESASLGQGRKSHTPPGEPAAVTRHVSAWLHADAKSMQYWEDEARKAREWAAGARDVQSKTITAERAAVMHLAKRLKNEISPEIASDAKGVQQDLLFEVMHQVNWVEIAEDMLSR